jgi:pSer/pThr/pTyr-binding forkhead associated (FHA) protein
LTDGDNLIGRDPLATVLLDVAGVSRRHARIVVRDGAAVLEDLGSKNGTQVEDLPVKGKVVLHDGNSIQVGPATVIYHAAASGMSTDTVVLPARTRQSATRKPNPARR